MRSPAPPTIPTISSARPAAPPADRRPHSPPDTARCRSAPTSAGCLAGPAFLCGAFAQKPTFALVPNRGHTPPPFPPLPATRDLAVIGPMARGAADLSLLLDVMAGPDPLEAGKAYSLSLPPPRHTSLKDFRILLIDSDPLLPTDKAVRAGIETLAANLIKSGVKVTRESPLWPDFAGSSRIYMRLLVGLLGASMPPEVYAGAQAGVAQ